MKQSEFYKELDDMINVISINEQRSKELQKELSRAKTPEEENQIMKDFEENNKPAK